MVTKDMQASIDLERQLEWEADMQAQYEEDMRRMYEEDMRRQQEADLAAGPDWDAWADALSPGDPCRVRWQGVAWDAKVQRIAPGGPTVLLIAAAGTLVPMVIGWEDIEPPQTKEAP